MRIRITTISIPLLILFSFDWAYAWVLDESEVTVFVSPDSSYSVLEEYIEDTNVSFYINTYTFDSPSIARLVMEAEERGVDVVLLVEPSPVGGISDEEKDVLDYLESSGVEVYYSDIEGLRFNHAKYAISDNSSILITTENFGKTGFSVDNRYGNRGFGVIVYDSNFTSYFLDIFFSDLNGSLRADVSGGAEDMPGLPATLPAAGFVDNGDRGQYTRKYSQRYTQRYSPKFAAERYSGTFRVVPVVAPENAIWNILNLIDSANSTLYVEQFYIYKHWGSKRNGSIKTSPNLFLEACIDAARRGVRVRILLDSTWYNIEKDDPTSNLYTVEYINEIAKKEGLDIEARLIDLRNAGFNKIHTKGVIVDNRAVLISSVNWNRHSPTKNREVGVIIYGAPARYFSNVFLYDFEGGFVGSESGGRGEPGSSRTSVLTTIRSIKSIITPGISKIPGIPIIPVAIAAGLSALFIFIFRQYRRRDL